MELAAFWLSVQTEHLRWQISTKWLLELASINFHYIFHNDNLEQTCSISISLYAAKMCLVSKCVMHLHEQSGLYSQISILTPLSVLMQIRKTQQNDLQAEWALEKCTIWQNMVYMV